MKRTDVVLMLALLVASACGGGSGTSPCAGKSGVAGTHLRTVTSSGVERTFRIDVPESALQGRPVPLVLMFHGVFSNGEAIQVVTGMPDKAAAEGFITAAGDGIGQSWNAGVCCDPAAADGVDDVQFTRDMVAAIEEEYCIDAEQIYASGFSNGGAMVFRLACDASDLFAAFGPVGGSLALFPCEPERVRPLYIINNVDDPVVPFTLGEFSFQTFTQVYNGCTDERTTESGPNSTCETAPVCADDTSTTLCGIDGISHVWPGGATDPDDPFRATDVVWDFFAGTESAP
jgi:polyhydroxybutyrate depolymerase